MEGGFVYSLCLSTLGRGPRRPSFISGCDQIFHMIRYDDTGPIKGWGSCEKCDDRASGRRDCDLTSERGERRGRWQWGGEGGALAGVRRGGRER